MTDLDYNDIRRLDGGLLIAFRELLIRRRTTEVARAMGLSQSAVSHALARLRDLFGDPLFIRRSHRLEPTRRAIELGPRIEALLELTAATLSGAAAFDPAFSRRRFTIAWPSDFETIFGAGLVEVFRKHAPNTYFSSRHLLLDSALESVLRGDADLAIGQFARIPTGLIAKTLYEDRYCITARKGHPNVQGSIDLETYRRIGHVYFGTPTGGSSVDEPIFDKVQSDRAYGPVPDPSVVRTIAYATSWTTALLLASQSDGVVDCPRRLARQLSQQLDLQILDAPYDSATYEVQLVRRADIGDEGVDWLEEQLFEIVNAQPPSALGPD